MEKVYFEVSDNYAVVKNGNGSGTLIARLPRSFACDVDKMRNELRVSNLIGMPQLIVKVEDISASNEYPAGNPIDLTDNDTIFTFFSAIFLGKGSSASGGGGNAAWELGGNSIVGTEIFGTTNKKDVKFITDNKERARLYGDGKLGIALTEPIIPISPAYRLHLFDANAANAPGVGIAVESSDATGNDVGFFTIHEGTIMSKFGHYGNLAQWFAPNSQMDVGTGANVPFRILTNGSVRLTVMGTGNVGIGTTTPAAALVVNSATALKVGGGSWGSISDISTKENISPIEPNMEDFLGLNPVTFNYTERFLYEGVNRTETPTIPEKEALREKVFSGLIAQELRAIKSFENCVETVTGPEGEERLAIGDYQPLIMTLIKVVQQHEITIRQLTGV